jgi:hypothetical protein
LPWNSFYPISNQSWTNQTRRDQQASIDSPQHSPMARLFVLLHSPGTGEAGARAPRLSDSVRCPRVAAQACSVSGPAATSLWRRSPTCGSPLRQVRRPTSYGFKVPVPSWSKHARRERSQAQNHRSARNSPRQGRQPKYSFASLTSRLVNLPDTLVEKPQPSPKPIGREIPDAG